jgi:hypothetical protein
MEEAKKRFDFKAGIIASLVGGLVMSIMLGMMGFFPGIAAMVGSNSSVVGFFVHMVISLLFGVAFSIFAGLIRLNPLAAGALFGIIIWIIGPLILMPMMMGSANPCGNVCGSASMPASQNVCGVASKSACGTVAPSACGDVAKSACGTAAPSACGDSGSASGSTAMLLSLTSHLLYGLVTGITFKAMKQS